jgi:predicted dehydrogenase
LSTVRRPVAIAVVGAGYWGPNLIRNIHALSGASLAIVCDRGARRLDLISRMYPEAAVTTDYEEVLSLSSIEAVVIATQVGTHAELAAAALEAGKHVLVEKPMATSVGQAESLIELAERSGLVLMPGHTFMYSPPVNAVRDLICSGALGEIHFISSSRVNLGLHQPDVSVVWDLGPHDFSILRHWLGESPGRVMAASRTCVVPGISDVAFISLDFPSGILAHVELAWLAPTKLRRTVVVGSEKMVVYDDTSDEPVRIFDSGVVLDDPAALDGFRPTYRTGGVTAPQVDLTEPLLLEVEDFCRAIRTGEPPISSAQIGLEIVRTLEAVDSALADGIVVEVARVSGSSR